MQRVSVGSLRDLNRVVVQDVDWTVDPGDYWVIAGLQGSGKSDFAMMTASLMPPASGDYQFFGKPMPIFDEARLQERLRLGLVFENAQLFNPLTVWENVALPLRYHEDLFKEEAVQKVQPLLDCLELEPWSDSAPGSLTRSWQKRVGLARALILQPDVLVVDNPLAGLDLRHIYWWIDFLQQLSKGHKLLAEKPLTLIVTTADLRPWKGRQCRFATLRNKRFSPLGGWSQIEAESADLVRELLMAEAKPG
jgi:ABC-type transporter Mla maintaining outer membrane lipid asymmetry ATPase subunit MlaF